MVMTYHLKTDEFWDIQKASILEYFFNVFSVFWKDLLHLTWAPLLPHCCFAAQELVTSCFQYWQRKDCLNLSSFGKSSKTGKAGKERGFRIRGLGGEVTSLAWKTLNLKSWHWSIRIASNVGFWHFLLKRSFLP